MNRYTISPEFLAYCAQDQSCDYFLNVLMVLTQDNQYKICMDNEEMAYARYEEIIERSEHLRFWLKMLNTRARNVAKITIPNKNYTTNQELFLTIADNVPPQKKLVTSDKSIYDAWQQEVQNHGITLIDGDEAKSQMQRPTIVQISTGANSPNIVGNQNKIK